MKLIDQNGRLFGKISVVDLLVILVVIVMAIAVASRDKQPVTSTGVPMQDITYQLKVTGLRSFVADNIQVGDTVFDADQANGSNNLGTILSIETSPGTRLSEVGDGTLAILPVEDSVDLLITIRGQGVITDGRYMLNRIYDLRVNTYRYFGTPYVQFPGTVSAIL